MLRVSRWASFAKGSPVALAFVSSPTDIRGLIKIQRQRKLEEAKREKKSSSSSHLESSSEHAEGVRDEDGDEVTDEELAEKCGLKPPSRISAADIKAREEALARLVRQQREKRLAKREAFLTWQAGQREKGAAMRLARQGRKAEAWKQQRATALGSRFLSTAVVDRDSGSNTNNSDDLHRQERWNCSHERLAAGNPRRTPRESWTMSEVLNKCSAARVSVPDGTKHPRPREGHSVFLALRSRLI